MIKKYCIIFVLVIYYCSLELAAMDYMGDFEKQLNQPDTEQVMQRASTIAEKYDLKIEWLRNYYCILQYLAKRIVNIAEIDTKVLLYSKIADALNPGIAQIEPRECIGVEFRNGLPTGFRTILGYFPICECGAIYDEKVINEILNIITQFLGLKKVKDLGPNASLYRCFLDDNQSKRAQSPAFMERRQEIPYDQAVDLWRAVKPEERGSYH